MPKLYAWLFSLFRVPADVSRLGSPTTRSTAWNPLGSQIFTRRLLDLAGELRMCGKCRHLFPTLLTVAQPRAVLDIGCGTTIALLDAGFSIRKHAPKAEWHNVMDRVCLVGLTSFRYTKLIYASKKARAPSLQEARAAGLSALFEEGPMDRGSLNSLSSTFHVNASELPKPPTVVDHDYNHGLPFRSQTFDLILEQDALKWNAPSQLPSPDAPTEDYVVFLLNEVTRVLSVNGSALLSLDKVRQNGLVRVARNGDVAWPWNSSGFVGDKTDIIVQQLGAEESAADSIGPRKHSAEEDRWLLRRRQIQRVMPLELSVAVASFEEAATGSLCSPPSCRPTVCEGNSSRGTPPSNHDRTCVFSYLFGTLGVGALFVHKFELPGATPGACAAAALELPMVRLMLIRTEGWLRPESRSDTLHIAAVMRTRARRAVAQRARAAAHSRRSDHPHRPSGRETLEPRAYLESVLGGVRLWMREPARCHAPVGEACKPESARIGWSDLHTFVPDTSPAAENRKYSMADLWAADIVARRVRNG